jgi:N-acetylmuramoyl-L-alanine amidase
MGLLSQSGKRRGCGWWGAVAVVGLCCGGVALGASRERVRVVPWDAAVTARQKFEAESAGTHTKDEYARVMDGFRAIYHADPGAAHAARAVEQVAELLAEEGREFSDTKMLRAAAGQYEFLVKSYPGGSLAPEALKHALELLGPDAVGDAVEARKVRAQLVEDYPKYARGLKREDGAGDTPLSQRRDVHASEQVRSSGAPDVGHTAERSLGNVDAVGREGADVVGAGPLHHDEEVLTVAPARGSGVERVSDVAEKHTGSRAVVTGIRHWSTASYTRVAIDLNVDSKDDVKYEAARVENPDRIFFDVQHARLAPGLAGKSFDITDDGFLTKIRAAQYSDEVTRVVLDVHAVAEYSAFLLPNPYRLIIDIHGKKDEGSGLRAQGPEGVGGGAAVVAGPAVRVPATKSGRVGMSSLPPMPVTDGSSGFGLPVRSSTTVESSVVAAPRVVISSKPTVAQPVPNTVTKSSKDTGFEVAAVSLQPGKVEATRRPTSKPVTDRVQGGDARVQGVEGRVQGSGLRAQGSSASADTELTGVVVPAAPKREAQPYGGKAVATPAEVAPPTADGQTSLMRALGLKIGRIVIDAGHGGHDSGTLGAGGIEEKDVVLDVALRLGKLLHDRLGAEIVYTRADDTFIPLETRTAIANKAQADLFVSVHANSSVDTDARGVEVYYLNFTSDPEAMRVASRENAVSNESVHDLSDLVKKIALKDKIDESKELAGDVDSSLYGGLRKGNAGLKDRGVKKAPFVVLIGANMPSILAEISFVTNAEDAAKLETPEYRERVAESLYKGVARYAAAINGREPGEVKAKVRTTEQARR